MVKRFSIVKGWGDRQKNGNNCGLFWDISNFHILKGRFNLKTVKQRFYCMHIFTFIEILLPFDEQYNCSAPRNIAVNRGGLSQNYCANFFNILASFLGYVKNFAQTLSNLLQQLYRILKTLIGLIKPMAGQNITSCISWTLISHYIFHKKIFEHSMHRYWTWNLAK